MSDNMGFIGGAICGLLIGALLTTGITKSVWQASAIRTVAQPLPPAESAAAPVMGTGVNIHTKESDDIIKVWYLGKTESEVRQELETVSDDGRLSVQVENGTIYVDKDDIVSIKYAEVSRVTWALDAGNL
jgi:hypothetical protein